MPVICHNPKNDVYFQNESQDGPSLTPINLHILRSLWLPDVEILDLKAFETHSVLSKLEGLKNNFFHFFYPGHESESFCKSLRFYT